MDDIVATGPDDIDAAIEMVRHLLADADPDDHNYTVSLSPRPAVNVTAMLMLTWLVRCSVQAAVDDPYDGAARAERVALLLDQIRANNDLPHATWTIWEE